MDKKGTQAEVYSVTKKYAGITVRFIIIAVLIILIVLFAFISSNSYSIKRTINGSTSSRNINKYMQTMDDYLMNQDYLAFYAFCEKHYISTYTDNYKDYSCLIYAASRYTFIYENIMKFTKFDDSNSLENQITLISDQLDDFYDIWNDNDTNFYSVGESKKNEKYALEIQEQIHALLVAYCGLTPEDVKELPYMTNAKRSLLIEERMTKEASLNGK